MRRLLQDGSTSLSFHSGAIWLGVLLVAVAAMGVRAQQAVPVTVEVEIVQNGANLKADGKSRADAKKVAVWLTPLQGTTSVPVQVNAPPRLVQHNKMFSPHVLVVQAGAMVEFPNEDPFFHNVFSLFAGKRFDLGLYEAGSSRTVRFDRPGASFLFCNIHPEMSAVIVVVPTPYYALADSTGRVTIPAVPDGRYRLDVWHERSSPEYLKNLEQVITVSNSSRTFGPIGILDNANLTLTHKNKYGQDYVPALTNATY
jgi:plastocyanin